MRQRRLLLFYVRLLNLIAPSRGQKPACPVPSVVNQSADLPFLRALYPNLSTVQLLNLKPYLGGRNQTHCCLAALDEYLGNNCTDTADVRVQDRFLDEGAPFPCAASYTGDVRGAPEVYARFGWAEQRCPGWSLSVASKSDQWAQLLVSFILPAVVFSFNVPRPRKLKIWEKFFPKSIASYRVVAGLVGALGAAICVIIDTIFWLMVCFAFSGPLLLSGLIEAQLDKRVLHFLEDEVRNQNLPLALRARILFTILCGNLDMYPAWSDTMDLARHLDDMDRESAAFTQPARRQVNHQVIQMESQRPVTPLSNTLHESHSPSRLMESDTASISSQEDRPVDGHDHDPLRPMDSLRPPSFRDFVSQRLGGSIDLGDAQRSQVAVSLASSAPLLPVNSSADTVRDEIPRVTWDSSSRHHHRGESTAEPFPNMPHMKAPSSATDSVPGTRSIDFGDTLSTHLSYDQRKTIRKVTVRLKAMLACQYSFGSTIGGPVVFFLGSFIYALLDIKQDAGDENLAEALSFGMFFIIIPLVAVTAGLLLAGNNPNILEGIVSIRDLRYTIGSSLIGGRMERRATVDVDAQMHRGSKGPTHFPSTVMERVYTADYTPAWMWDRGRCKQDWLVVLFTDSWLKYQHNDELPPRVRLGLETFLVETIMLGPGDWTFLFAFAFLLIFIPCMFSFLNAYYTPSIGIGCRAITFLIYMCSQTLLLLLWTYYLTWRDKYWATAQKIKRLLQKPRFLQSRQDMETLVAELKAQAVRDTNMPSRNRRFSNESEYDPLEAQDKAHPFVKIFFYSLCIFGSVVGLFSSIGGTLLQIIGVYRNNTCAMNAPNWPYAKRIRTFIQLSTNLSEAIEAALRYWIVIGSFSVVFLGIVCYIGWWYQKRLRSTFIGLANKLGGDEMDYELVRMRT